MKEKLIFLPAYICWFFYAQTFSWACRKTGKAVGFEWSYKGVRSYWKKPFIDVDTLLNIYDIAKR